MPQVPTNTTPSITLGLGNLGFAFGPGTMAVVFRQSATGGSFPMMLTVGAVLATGYGIYIGTGSGTFNSNLNDTDGQGIVIGTNKWYIAGYSKASGAVRCRFFLYDYSSGGWTHFDEIAFGNQNNSSVPVTKAQFFRDGGATIANHTGQHIEAAAVWDVVLTDAQKECLVGGIPSWYAPKTPRGMWYLAESATTNKIRDITGGAADESARANLAISTLSCPWKPYGG